MNLKKICLALSLAVAFCAFTFAQTPARVFHGEIMDSQCASMGSHAAGYKMTGTHTPRACTLACVKAGGQFVLYNPATKTTYKLDNQRLPRRYAGERVRVTGVYDSATQTIHVKRIARGR